jgi:hypothetical protein
MVYTLDGKECRESTGTDDFDEAQRMLRERLHTIDEGNYIGPERDRLTIGELLTGLLDFYVVQGHRSLPSAKAQAKAIRAVLGSCRALDVTTGRVRRVTKAWQEAKVTNATINRRLALLRRAYSLGKLVLDPTRLDFSDLFLVENSPLGRHIDAAAFAAIHQHLPPWLQPFFEFAYLCGTRKGNLARTTWAHWNPQTKEFTWTAAEVKAKRPHVLRSTVAPLRLSSACTKPASCTAATSSTAAGALSGTSRRRPTLAWATSSARGPQPARRRASRSAVKPAASSSTTPGTPPSPTWSMPAYPRMRP